MTTIYIVRSGKYSDQLVDEVFSTEELAQAYIDKRVADDKDKWYTYDGWIDERELDAPRQDWIEGKAQSWQVRFKHGSADVDEISEWSPGPWKDHEESYYHGYVYYVFAQDKQSAAKIAMEKRSVDIANGMNMEHKRD